MERGLLLVFLTLMTSSLLIGDANAETHNLCEGDNLTLSCDCPGSDSNVSWTYVSLRNTSMANGIDGVDLVICNTTCTTCNYTLDNVNSADNGIYSCLINGTIEMSKYNVTVATPHADDTVCSSSPSTTSTTTSGTTSSAGVYVITDENFYIRHVRRDNGSVYVGDNVTLECVTNVNGTSTQWRNESAMDDTMVLVDVSVDDNGSVFVCELFATSEPNATLDTRMTTIFVIDPQSTPTSLPTGPASSQSTSTESTDARTATPTSESNLTTTVLPTGGSSPNIAAIAGGAAGGAVFLILIIIIIIVCCRSKRKSDVNGDNVVHRLKKKTAKPGSKKHRSAILSLRHKLPLFSTPYDDSDDNEGVSHSAPVNTDVDTIIMEYRPKSKIASQIRVDLAADDGDEGTVENGFVPVNLGMANEEDESPYSMGVVEGRFGILGPGTFTAANTNSEKPIDIMNENQDNDDDNDKTGEDMTNPYTKVYKANTPGDSSFDNMLYGPIKGVDDKTKTSMYDEESSPAKLPESNETDIAGDVDTPNGNVDIGDDDVSKVVSGDTDITKEKPDTDRESAAYAEIPPPIAMD